MLRERDLKKELKNEKWRKAGKSGEQESHKQRKYEEKGEEEERTR